MNPSELAVRAALVVDAEPGIGPDADLGSLRELAAPLVDETTSFGDALRAVAAAVRRPPIHQAIDVGTGAPWRSSPALVAVDVALNERTTAEVELVPEPHVRMVRWSARAADVPRPPLVERLASDPPEAGLHAAIAALGAALRRWEVGVPFAAGEVASAAARVGPLVGRTATLDQLAETATRALVAEVEDVPGDVLRTMPALRDEIRRWAEDAPTGSAPTWRALLDGYPPLWDEPDPSDIGLVPPTISSRPVPLSPVFAGSGPRSVPVRPSAEVFDLRLLDLGAIATAVTQGDLVAVRVPLRAVVGRRLVAAQRALAALAGETVRHGDRVAAELAWWRLRAVAVLPGNHQAVGEGDLDALRLPELAMVPLGPDGGDEYPLSLAPGATALVAAVPAGVVVDEILVCAREAVEAGADHALAQADRLASTGAWDRAAHAYEAAAALIGPAVGHGDPDEGRDVRSESLFVVAAIRAAHAWGLHAAAGGAGPAPAVDSLTDRARAMVPPLAEALTDALARALPDTSAAVELGRVRDRLVARLERNLDGDRDGTLLADHREVGVALAAVDIALGGRPQVG